MFLRVSRKNWYISILQKTVRFDIKTYLLKKAVSLATKANIYNTKNSYNNYTYLLKKNYQFAIKTISFDEKLVSLAIQNFNFAILYLLVLQ